MHGSKCDQVSSLNITGKLKVVVAIGDEQRIIVEIIMYDYLGTSYYRIVGCLFLMVAHKPVILYMFMKLAWWLLDGESPFRQPGCFFIWKH
jgi:hypothetical protein